MHQIISKNSNFILSLILLFSSSLSQAQYFDGLTVYGTDTLHFNLEIKNVDDKQQAFFSSDEQKAFDIPCFKTVYLNGTIEFYVFSDFYIYEYKYQESGDLYLGKLQIYSTEDEKLLNSFETKLIKSIEADNDKTTRISHQFESNGLKLSGSLWTPEKPNGKGIFIITSSQGSDRRSSNAEAQYFSSLGFHVFHFDKRGTGSSEGNWENASIEELSSDDIQGIKYFAKEASLKLSDIGITGSSQGGIKVPYILSMLPELGFGIPVSCPGVSLLESDLNFWKNRNRENIGADLEEASQVQKMAFEYVADQISYQKLQEEINKYQGKEWMQNVWIPEQNFPKDVKLNFSGMDYFPKVSQPILVIQGLSDEIIPMDSYIIIDNTLKESGNKNYQIVTLENTTHSMTYVDEAYPYFQKLNPEYLTSMKSWLEKSIINKD